MNDCSAMTLLREASVLFDSPDNRLAKTASEAWKQGFTSGGEWMRQALAIMRNNPADSHPVPFARLGILKYGLTAGAGALIAGIALAAKQPWMLFLGIPVFYLV